MGWKVEYDIVEMSEAKIIANAGKVTIITSDGKKYTYTFNGFKKLDIPGTWTPAKVIYETDYPTSVFKIEGAIKKETLKGLAITFTAIASSFALAYLLKKKMAR